MDLQGCENYYDVIIGIFHNIIVNHSVLIESVSTIMIILVNLSAYVKKISYTSSTKLFSIFEYFASKKFIYKEAGNYQYLYQILEIINNRMQYQYDGSLHLIYKIISKKDLIEKLINSKYEYPSDSTWEISEEWFRKWKNELPVGLVLALHRDLIPRLEKLSENNSQIVDVEIIEFLGDSTMVGVFPVPHALFFRKFHATKQIVG